MHFLSNQLASGLKPKYTVKRWCVRFSLHCTCTVGRPHLEHTESKYRAYWFLLHCITYFVSYLECTRKSGTKELLKKECSNCRSPEWSSQAACGLQITVWESLAIGDCRVSLCLNTKAWDLTIDIVQLKCTCLFWTRLLPLLESGLVLTLKT